MRRTAITSAAKLRHGSAGEGQPLHPSRNGLEPRFRQCIYIRMAARPGKQFCQLLHWQGTRSKSANQRDKGQLIFTTRNVHGVDWPALSVTHMTAPCHDSKS